MRCAVFRTALCAYAVSSAKAWRPGSRSASTASAHARLRLRASAIDCCTIAFDSSGYFFACPMASFAFFFCGTKEKGLARARNDSSRNVCTHNFEHDRDHAITIARMQIRKHSAAHASTPAAPRWLSHASTPAVATHAIRISTCTIPNTSSPYHQHIWHATRKLCESAVFSPPPSHQCRYPSSRSAQ